MLDFLGVELHPRVLGVDVKQWTNCRVGMLGWALLTIVYFVAGLQVHYEMPSISIFKTNSSLST